MHTFNFAKARQLPAEYRPVGIASRPPHWWHGENYSILAPAARSLHLPREEYDRLFFGRLRGLNPERVFADLGERAILLCFEPPNVWCHRRAVAEWLETALGIIIPEWGFAREAVLPYKELR